MELQSHTVAAELTDNAVAVRMGILRSGIADISYRSPRLGGGDACLKACKHNFCIIRALTRAQQGDVETGLVFTGEYMPKIDKIMSVHDIFAQLKAEAEAAD